MSIRTKILIFFTAIIILVAGAVFSLSKIFLLKSFDHLQNAQTIEAVQRATDTVNDNAHQLSTKLSDWSNWDDTYIFAVNHNKNYITSNLPAATLVNLDLNYMLFYNAKHQLFEGLGVGDDGNFKQVPASLSSTLERSGLMDVAAGSDGKYGVLLSDEGPLLIAARPIQTSNATGPSHGTLIFASYLSNQLPKIADITHLQLSITTFSDVHAPADVRAQRMAIVKSLTAVKPLSAQQIAGYALINDVNGRPALIARVLLPRDIHREGLHALTLFIVYFGAAALVACTIAYVLLDVTIVRRLSRLSRQVEGIGTLNSNLVQVNVAGRDELSTLGSTINSMLKRLYESRFLEERNVKLNEKVAHASEELEQERRQLRAQLAEAQRINQIMVNRELKMIELKKRLAKYEPETAAHKDEKPSK